MKATLKTAFSILDGRVSTDMDDVRNMLNYIHDSNLYTHQLPAAMDMLRQANPKWFADGIQLLNNIKEKYKTNDFNDLMSIIDKEYSTCKIRLSKINTIINKGVLKK